MPLLHIYFLTFRITHFQLLSFHPHHTNITQKKDFTIRQPNFTQLTHSPCNSNDYAASHLPTLKMPPLPPIFWSSTSLFRWPSHAARTYRTQLPLNHPPLHQLRHTSTSQLFIVNHHVSLWRMEIEAVSFPKPQGLFFDILLFFCFLSFKLCCFMWSWNFIALCKRGI